MTLTLGINQENDIYLGNDGNIALLSGIEAVAGGCETASKAQLGEMIFATTQGLPNFQTVWNGVPNLGIWQSYLRSTLLQVDGVDEINDLVLASQSGTLVYQATVKTQYGITQVNG